MFESDVYLTCVMYVTLLKPGWHDLCKMNPGVPLGWLFKLSVNRQRSLKEGATLSLIMWYFCI